MLSLLLAGVGLALVAGCGPSRPTLIPVSGKVTYGGGAWPKKGTIYFTCEKPADGYPSRPGTGEFDTDGSFTVTSYEGGAGLHPGKYVARVECWEVEPNMEGKPTKSYVPGMAPKLELEVLVTDSAKTVTFDIPKQ